MELASDLRPRRLASFSRWFAPIARAYFRYTLRGFEELPPPPVLFVGNHSAFGAVEIMALLAEWQRRSAGKRPGVGLAHDALLALPVVGGWARSIGAVPASRENALAYLGAGYDVLVFPGGDRESARPFFAPRKLCTRERRGYARLALDAHVPVVPVATIGSHWTYPMLPGGERLARALGLDRRFRIDAVPLPAQPIVFGLAALGALRARRRAVAGVLAALMPLAPPVRVTTAFLPALDLDALVPGGLAREERVERAHGLIHGALADALATMTHGGRLTASLDPSRRPRRIAVSLSS